MFRPDRDSLFLVMRGNREVEAARSGEAARALSLPRPTGPAGWCSRTTDRPDKSPRVAAMRISSRHADQLTARPVPCNVASPNPVTPRTLAALTPKDLAQLVGADKFHSARRIAGRPTGTVEARLGHQRDSEVLS